MKVSNRNKSYGFTIVELLVVIVVIGILAVITIVSYTGVSTRATITSLQSDLANAKKQLSLYYTDHGFYPTSIDAITKCPKDSGGTPDTKYCLKPSNGSTFTHYPLGVSTSPDGFGLIATKGTTNYTITNNSTPAVMSTLATTDSANWLTIGTQVWAKYNLNVGTMVPGTLGGNNLTNQTNNATIEKYCYQNDPANCTTYGGLYQWDEAMQYVTTEGVQGVCPSGSHIPTDNDLKILEMQLGMSQSQADILSIPIWRGTDQGTQLKSGGTSGLNILIAGGRYTDGSFSWLLSQGFLWTSSNPAGLPLRRGFGPGQATILRDGTEKDRGFPVRCLAN